MLVTGGSGADFGRVWSRKVVPDDEVYGSGADDNVGPGADI